MEPKSPRKVVAYLLPLASLAIALGFHAKPPLFDDMPGPALTLLGVSETALLIATVFAALYHAELVAKRLGEPLGTLVLTIAVTIIEVSIIVSMMLHGANNPTLAREAVFSVVMIIGSGVIGICLTVGALYYREQELKQQATSAFLAVLIALCVLVLILPDFGGGGRPGAFGTGQLVFVAHRLGTALPRLPVHADRSPSRRLRRARAECHCARGRRLRQPPDQPCGPGELPPSARRPLRRRASRRSSSPRRSRMVSPLWPLPGPIASWGPSSPAGPAAGDDRAIGAALGQPPAAQPQHRSRIGARHNRAHHPFGRGRQPPDRLRHHARPRQRRQRPARS